ncbi:hypothetical protein CIW48_13780 [Methylobacterium sp. P1-11]|nr:hypothetical protein CIW48_13780 [Methylobacterium sp. P1-11]
MSAVQNLFGSSIEEQRPPALVDNRQPLLELINEGAKRALDSVRVWRSVLATAGHAFPIREGVGRILERRRRQVGPERLLVWGSLHEQPLIRLRAKHLVGAEIVKLIGSQHV